MAPGARAKWVRDRTDRKLTATVTRPLRAASDVTELHAALAKVVDVAATPDLVPKGAMILQPSDERRRSGSHYTPRELTAPIVEHALDPVLDPVRNGGAWTAERLLGLKICDPAMGSGAFLVEACRQLGDALAEAWRVHGDRPEIPPDEDEVVFAQRQIAQRCLYGVDRNPMAVDLAKMSLWLATLARNEPLTFVDHALRDGDSLVGLTRRQIAAFSWERGHIQAELGTRVDDAVERVATLRCEIREAGRGTPQVELEDTLREAEKATKDVRFFGDLAIDAFFMEKKVTARKKRRLAHLAAVQDGKTAEHRERLAEKRRGSPPFAPFHWEIEFPEVFDRDNPGFDVFVGNPPFAGKNTVAAGNVPGYPLWLKAIHEESHGNADLVAHFFRRTFDLLRHGGTFGLIATNTIGQGDTRSTGLRWICLHDGEIYRAQTRVRWPGLAAVVVSVVHATRGSCRLRAAAGRKGGGRDHGVPVPRGRPRGSGAAGGERGSELPGKHRPRDGLHLRRHRQERGRDPRWRRCGGLIRENPRKPRRDLPVRRRPGGVNTSPTHAHHRYVINFRDYPLRREDLGALWAGADGEQRREWLRTGNRADRLSEAGGGGLAGVCWRLWRSGCGRSG